MSPYVEGKWGKIGYQLGESLENRKEKKKRLQLQNAMLMTQQQLQQQQMEEEEGKKRLRTAQGDIEEERMGADMPGFQQELLREPSGLEPGEEGPLIPETAPMQRFLDRIGEIAQTLPEDMQAEYLINARKMIFGEIRAKSRKETAEAMQDRLADGAYNYLDEDEPNPAYASRIESLIQSLDDEETDPFKVLQIEQEILEGIAKENERRQSNKTLDNILTANLQEYEKLGDKGRVKELTELQQLWNSRLLTAPQVSRDLDSIQRGAGRGAAGEGKPSVYQQAQLDRQRQQDAVERRKESLKYYDTYQRDKRGGAEPTPGILLDIERFLFPEVVPGPEVIGADIEQYFKPGAFAPGAAEGRQPSRGKAAPGAPPAAGGPPGAPPSGGAAAPSGLTWGHLTPLERTLIEKDLADSVAKGRSTVPVLHNHRLSKNFLDTLPDALKHKLRRLAKPAKAFPEPDWFLPWIKERMKVGKQTWAWPETREEQEPIFNLYEKEQAALRQKGLEEMRAKAGRTPKDRPPPKPTRTTGPKPPVEPTEQGNIDLETRPKVKNPDGTTSSLLSMSFEENGVEILIPTISPQGSKLSEEEAISLYHRTGKHLGKFKNAKDATAYSKWLSAEQGRRGR